MNDIALTTTRKQLEDMEGMSKYTFRPQEFQKTFAMSTAPFPCRVGPWCDGKTVCMIMMGIKLSQMYPGNEGLIIRKRFNALQRSTMRDFTKWTGIKVPEQKKSIELPCGSTIHFSHCENMDEFRDSLHGMNLGWAAIEQGDELESADVFEMLIGRVRRIITPIPEIQTNLIRRKVLKKQVDSFEKLDRETRRICERTIIEKMNLPVRQIITIANACGHNWIWKRWHPDSKEHMTIADGYSYSEGKPFENVEFLPDTTIKNWNTLKKSSIKKYNRYVLNSHEDYDIEGAYYAHLMSDALKERRVELDCLYERTEPVITFWDLGVSDDTAIWFVQLIDDEIRLIDYYSNNGYGIEHYSDVLNERPYAYAEHYLPHDAAQRLQAGQITTRLDILRRLRGPNEMVKIVASHRVEERIQAARSLIPKCKFANKAYIGVECLNHYKREINKAKSTEEETFYLPKPSHDKYSHGADAFGYLAIAFKYMNLKNYDKIEHMNDYNYMEDIYGGTEDLLGVE